MIAQFFSCIGLILAFRNFNEMSSVSSIMSKPVITLTPLKTVLEAAKLMAENDIESIVVEWSEEAVGIITEKDIVRRIIAKELSYSTQLAKVLSKPLVTINSSASLVEAARKMRDLNVKRLAVMDHGVLKGIVTESDLLNR
jgi:CBS domain-containing protein